MVDATPISDFWTTGFLSVGLIMATVLFHYEALRIYTRMLEVPGRHPRVRILYLVFGLFFLHITEIVIFALAFWALTAAGFGELHGMQSRHFFSYFYYSAVVYTTLGFGDIIPLGPTKILTALEALIGLGFITWSASFTFLEMQRYWRDDQRGNTSRHRKRDRPSVDR